MMTNNFPSTWDPQPDLIPARMLNEYLYCPRLAYLEWVQGEFAESKDTVEGGGIHRGVDDPPDADRPPPTDGDGPMIVDSAYLSAPELGITGIADRVEFDGRAAVPVDFKHGPKPPDTIGVWDADRVQIGALAMMLEAQGYHVAKGVVYYSASKERLDVPLDDSLRQLVRDAIANLRRTADSGNIPPPLIDSNKCPRCSLAGICLPDETVFLNRAAASDSAGDDNQPETESPVRRILPSADEALPVHLQTQGLYVGKSRGMISIKEGNRVLRDVPLHEMSSLCLYGNIQVTTQAMQTLCANGVPVAMFSMGGWFYGIAHGLEHKNVELRRLQYRAADAPGKCLKIARALISDKIRNCRTLLRRLNSGMDREPLARLKELASLDVWHR